MVRIFIITFIHPHKSVLRIDSMCLLRDMVSSEVNDIQYIAKNIHSPTQIIKIRCSNHFHGHRCIKASTQACRLFLQTFVKEQVALRSSVNSSLVLCHLCNTSSREISSPLNIPQSTVSGIIRKWKRLGMTNWEPGLPVQHQCVTSQTCFWKNGQKFP